MTSDLERFGRGIADALGEPKAPSRTAGQAAMRRAIAEHQQSPRQRPTARRAWWMPLGIASATSAALGVALFLWIQRDTSARVECRLISGEVVATGRWLVPATTPMRLDFSEGSSVSLQQGAKARVDTLDQRGATLTLASGRLRASVRKQRLRWRFLAGPYRVHVVGTQLAIDWRPDSQRIDVQVARGAVRVTGKPLGDRTVLVNAGHRLRADRNQVHLAAAEDQSDAPPVDAAIGDNATDGIQAIPDTAPTTRPRPRPALRGSGTAALLRKIRTLIGQEEAEQALALIKRSDLHRLIKQLNGEELLVLANAARLSDDLRVAGKLYSQIRRRSAGSRTAAWAALWLARLAFDQRRDYAAAARWFRAFLREARAGDPLIANARGRLMLALERSGQLSQARAVARSYLAQHPRGAYTAAARKLTDEAAGTP